MKAGTAILFSSTTASLRESIVCYIGASILACNIVAVLLNHALAINGHC